MSDEEGHLAATDEQHDTDAMFNSEQLNTAAFAADLENRYMQLKQEKETLETATAEKESIIQVLRTKQEDLQQNLNTTETKLADAQRESLIQKEQRETIQAENQTKQERVDRMQAEADTLREEISRLVERNKQSTEKIVELEAMSKLSDSQAVPLQYEVNRTRKELDSLTSHTQWLESELQNRSNRLASLQQKHSAEIMDLQQKLDRVTEERDDTTRALSKLERSTHSLHQQLEQTSSELKDAKQEAATVVEASQTELVQERRLVALQKEQLDRVKALYEDAVKEVVSQRSLATQASTKTHEQIVALETELKEASERILMEQARDYEQKLESLQTQVQEAEHKRQEAEEGLRVAPRRRLIGAIADESEGRAAAGDSNDGPLGLTDLYERLARTEDELHLEKTESKRLRLTLDKILADVEAKTPKMVRQRKEYERAIAEAEDARDRIKEAMGEMNSYRQENRELSLEKGELMRRDRELQQENRALAQQVQALLRSRAGDQESGGEIPVTIAEIQTQNQTLLQEHRRLANEISDLKAQLETDPLKIRCEKAEHERDTLRENEKRQETLVTGIVQQRDLYRALLAKHDGALVNESTTEIIEAQSEKTKKLEELKVVLETDLGRCRSELTAAVRDKEVLEARMARYETHTADLTRSVDSLQAKLASAKADIARSGAEAGYHREKCTRIEESLQLARDESKRLQEAKDQMQAVVSNQQETVAGANAEALRCEQELRQVERKLKLSATQLQTAKASETHLLQEVSNLRSDITRQGALLESVRRIETSLSAKSEEQKNSLKEEVERLTQRVESEESKHSIERESLSGRIRELEVDMKGLESKREENIAAMVKAKDEAGAALANMKSLEARCRQLEGELRSAKMKLGEAGDDLEDPPEIALQRTVESLNTDLKKAELDLETATKRAKDYQQIAKASEDALADLTKSTNDYKNATEDELQDLKRNIDQLKTESESKQEVIVDLTKDLSSLRGEQDKVVADLKGTIIHLEEEATTLRLDAEAALSRASAMEADIAAYRADAKTAQNNYERELNLHSTARTDLRKAREEIEVELRLRKVAEEQRESLRLEMDENARIWREEEIVFKTTIQDHEKALEETRAQVDILHSQLAKLGDQIERRQAEEIESAAEEGSSPDADETRDLRSTVTDLRQVVRFLRSEREMSQAQVDAARRTAEREKAAATVVRRSLEEARTELKVLREGTSTMQSPAGTFIGEEAWEAKLQAAEGQLTLLRESNKLLRDDTAVLKVSISSLEAELESTKKSVAPNEEKQRLLEVEKAALEAEKASLVREMDAWKGRVHTLVSKFHQIDPDEHRKALQKIEEVSKQVEEAESQKASAQRELTSAKTLMSRMNKDLATQKALVESHKKMVTKLQSTASSQASAEVVKERSEQNKKIKQLEETSKSTKTELAGANQRIESLKNHLRNFQKQILDLRKKNSDLEKAAKSTEAQGLTSATAPATTQGQASSEQSAMAVSTSEVASKPAAGEAHEEKPSSKTQGLPNALPALPAEGFKFGPGTAGAEEHAPSTSTVVHSKIPTEEKNTENKILGEKTTAEPESKKPDTTTKPMSAEDKIRERLLQRKRKALEGLEKAKEAKTIKVTEVAGEPKAVQIEQPSSSSTDMAKSDEPTTTIEIASEVPAASTVTTPVAAPVVEATDPGTAVQAGSISSAPPALSATAAPFKPSATTEHGEQQRETEAEDSKVVVPVASQAGEESTPADEAKHGEQEAEAVASEPAGDTSAEGGEQSASAEGTKEGKDEGESTQEQAKPPAFGSTPFGSGFSSNATPFGGTPFGSGAPLPYGTSAPFTTGAADNTKPTGEVAFGGGSSFLDMKPPSSGAAPFGFGSSPNIQLPMPIKGATPIPTQSPFGTLGGSTSSGSNPFGGSASTQAHQPLFGSSSGTKRPAPKDIDDDEVEQTESSKEARLEEGADDEAEEDEGEDEDFDDEEAEEEEGEIEEEAAEDDDNEEEGGTEE